MSWDMGDVIAAIALLLSLVATFMTWHFNKQQKAFMQTQERLNTLLLERETAEQRSEKRADLGASFLKIGRSYRLKVYNKGKAPARNVRIAFPAGNTTIVQSDIEAKFPFEILDIHQSVELMAAVHLGSDPKLPLTLMWADDFSETNQKQLYPTL